MMPNEYSLQELAQLTGVTPRTIRYYIAQGLLPAPSQAGPAARYSDTHLERIRIIKKLQSAHLPLAEIRNQLRGMPEEEIATIAESGPAPQMDSASDYIRDLLGKPAATRFRLSPSAPAAMPSMKGAAEVAPLPTKEDVKESERAQLGRAQWERISLNPDIELHIRRPLTRQLNKRVERLITIARQLLEED